MSIKDRLKLGIIFKSQNHENGINTTNRRRTLRPLNRKIKTKKIARATSRIMWAEQPMFSQEDYTFQHSIQVTERSQDINNFYQQKSCRVQKGETSECGTIVDSCFDPEKPIPCYTIVASKHHQVAGKTKCQYRRCLDYG